jgi:hypothetical protein
VGVAGSRRSAKPARNTARQYAGSRNPVSIQVAVLVARVLLNGKRAGRRQAMPRRRVSR